MSRLYGKMMNAIRIIQLIRMFILLPVFQFFVYMSSTLFYLFFALRSLLIYSLYKYDITPSVSDLHRNL